MSIGVGKTLLRGGIYRYRQEERAQRLARYLAFRIDRDTQAEDVQLTVWSNEAMTSTAFAGFSLYIGSASHFIMDILHLKEKLYDPASDVPLDPLEDGAEEDRPVKQGAAEDAAFLMKNAGKVIIVRPPAWIA